MACIDDESSFFLENNKTIDDLNLEDLLGRLKTQAFVKRVKSVDC
nr:hypothetical protein [Helicobacter pylori]